MTNSEKKIAQWNDQLKSFNHLENYCKIEVRGLEDDNIYYHPIFILDENVCIYSQADIGNNKSIYALRFQVSEPNHFSVEIYESLLDNVIVGYSTNKESVMLALNTLTKVKDHVRKLDSYANEYINNILIGDSLEELGKSFIEEIRTTNKLISFMKNELKK